MADPVLEPLLFGAPTGLARAVAAQCVAQCGHHDRTANTDFPLGVAARVLAFGLISAQADSAFVAALKRRFPGNQQT